jgi:acyl-CoA reductase-like NAD-dependent aldehyde dehydrogenase
MDEVGVPTAWCQVCVCDRAAAKILITDARVAFMTFIGSARVGWELRRQLASGTRCSLEHGGVAPAIVAADADLNTAIPALVTGGYYHSGQVCVSVQRVFVDNVIKAEFIKELKSQVSKLVVGDPTEINTQVGPLIRPSEVDRVEEWVNEAIEAGAKCEIGGKRINDHFYAPTILVDPPHDSKVSSQEVFGPVVCVYGYDELQDAITLANALPVAFQAAVFTENSDVAMDAVNRLDAAAVMVNDHTAFRVDWMPFAGRRMSGLGTGGIRYTMEDMTQDKLVVTKA